MARYREWDLQCKVYVGNLGSSASKHEIESAFGKYGPLRNVWVARNPPGFAFVEFEDKRDAEDAVRSLDGTRCCGTRIRVEMSSGRTRRDDRRRPPRRSYRLVRFLAVQALQVVSHLLPKVQPPQPSPQTSLLLPPQLLQSPTSALQQLLHRSTTSLLLLPLKTSFSTCSQPQQQQPQRRNLLKFILPT
ncbi:polyadenylate-binding protein 3-like isoform X1 [Armigeres subalbatus]|uniref:polyadenylate-binding protein 3-like isoform X1 n=1 Tax=Armigeres subalbatus TaxID=124917 RepID=UPI002ED5A802